MEVFSGRVKDGRESWLFLAVIGCSMILNVGPFDSFGILVVVFKEYFDETNTKIGKVTNENRKASLCRSSVNVQNVQQSKRSGTVVGHGKKTSAAMVEKLWIKMFVTSRGFHFTDSLQMEG